MQKRLDIHILVFRNQVVLEIQPHPFTYIFSPAARVSCFDRDCMTCRIRNLYYVVYCRKSSLASHLKKGVPTTPNFKKLLIYLFGYTGS